MVRFSHTGWSKNVRTTGPSLDFESSASIVQGISIERSSRLRLNRDDGH